jgi:formylglycine-generating enzyme required for sulfatase activity
MLLSPMRCGGAHPAARVIWSCALAGGVLSLAGCEWWAQHQARKLSEAPETQTKVAALKGKTLKQLSHVPGGAFWLGDFGVLMDQQAKDTDSRPGPDAKLGDGLQFTIDEDNKPPKWVELDGFSIQQYKVT